MARTRHPLVTASGLVLLGLAGAGPCAAQALPDTPGGTVAEQRQWLLQQVRIGEVVAPISMGEGPRQMFVTGTWDACGQLVAQADAIAATANKLPYVQWSRLSA